ncbi:hypothetical protein ACIQXV_08275 [Neobacillus sp. NPDC097160]|uniref:hypothetical protein n=1 Tax=Neobacillus sp. NPDC097160 TaxID=3364298 RepID=UPI003820A3C3
MIEIIAILSIGLLFTVYILKPFYENFGIQFIEVGLSKQESNKGKQLIIDTLMQAYESWNIEAEKSNGHFIKFIRYIKKIRNKYVFYFDLGSSGNEAISFLIQSLATNVNLSISKIFVKQNL